MQIKERERQQEVSKVQHFRLGDPNNHHREHRQDEGKEKLKPGSITFQMKRPGHQKNAETAQCEHGKNSLQRKPQGIGRRSIGHLDF